MEIKFRTRRDGRSEPRIRLSTVNVDNIYILFLYVGSKVMYISWNKFNRTPKQWYRWNKYRLTRWFERIEKRVEHWYRYNFENKVVYYALTSMDCDCCESTSFGTCDNYKEYCDWLNDESEWDWVEGRTSVDILTKEDWEYYKEQPRRTRDYIMEAYEDGRGSHVNI